MSKSNFEDCFAYSGGALAIFNSLNFVNIIENSSFSNNRASSYGGSIIINNVDLIL